MHAHRSTSGSRFFTGASAFYLVVATAGVVGLGWRRNAPLGLDTFIDPGGWGTDLALGVALGAALIGSWLLLARLAPGARRVEAELVARLGDLSRGEAAALAVISAVAEEVAFRGALQAWFGWPAAALLFALAHLGPGRHFLWWSGWALAGGSALGLLVAERGALGGAILAHFLLNAVQLARLRGRGAPPAA